ncbi:MAG: PLP-dependent aminotransferase family protein [Gemmatimonadales bacterium]
MPRRSSTIGLTLPPRDPRAPAQLWLYRSIRNEILEGHLRPGARLPATRDLAREHGLSRGTIVSAFDQLRAEGYIESALGSGTYVNKILPEELLQIRGRRPARSRPHPSRPPRRISDYARRITPFPPFPSRPVRAFRANQPALDLFPTTLWSQVTARRLRLATTDLLRGCGPMGYPPLQEAIVDYLRAARGVKCEPEQVAIVSGIQEALDLVGRVLLNCGDRVCIEEPGYLGAARVFEGMGARICPVPVDAEGMEVPAGRHREVRLAYVTPAHQFPLGVSMSLCRRLELLRWARQTGAVLFEDDYDSEYRYAGRPMPALQGLDKAGVVVFAGSFSKVLFPSIRMGYLVVPPDLVDHVSACLSITSRHAPLLEQAVVCDFITEGHFGRHIRRMRAVYAERLGVLLESARARLGGVLEISSVEAGLQTVGWIRPSGVKAAVAADAAARRDVEVIPLSRYCRSRQAREGLKLGFAAVDPREIRRGVEELARVLGARTS